MGSDGSLSVMYYILRIPKHHVHRDQYLLWVFNYSSTRIIQIYLINIDSDLDLKASRSQKKYCRGGVPFSFIYLITCTSCTADAFKDLLQVNSWNGNPIILRSMLSRTDLATDRGLYRNKLISCLETNDNGIGSFFAIDMSVYLTAFWRRIYRKIARLKRVSAASVFTTG